MMAYVSLVVHILIGESRYLSCSFLAYSPFRLAREVTEQMNSYLPLLVTKLLLNHICYLNSSLSNYKSWQMDLKELDSVQEDEVYESFELKHNLPQTIALSYDFVRPVINQ